MAPTSTSFSNCRVISYFLASTLALCLVLIGYRALSVTATRTHDVTMPSHSVVGGGMRSCSHLTMRLDALLLQTMWPSATSKISLPYDNSIPTQLPPRSQIKNRTIA